MSTEEKLAEEKPAIVIRGADVLNIKVTASTHTVMDEKGKTLFEKR